MKRQKTSFLMILILLAAFIGNISCISAQEQKPEAILVRLRTGHQRLKKFNEKSAAVLKLDLEKVSQVTRNDFHDHFTLCPVYYFYDVDMPKVLDGQLSGVLMDTTLSKIPETAVPRTNNFLIAYFGETPPFAKGRGKDTALKVDITHAASKGLIILDSKGDLKQHPFPFFIGRNPYKARVVLTMEKQYLNQRYNYSSTTFDDDYLMSAGRLQERMDKYYESSETKAQPKK